MESQLNQREHHEIGLISEYEEAAKRFETFKKTDKCLNLHSLEEGHTGNNLGRIIERLCNGGNCELETKDVHLFYDLIIHADFIQIKTDLVEAFYTQLCDVFVMSELIDAIIQNLPRLNNIPQVKKYVLQGFLKILQVNTEVENDTLRLTFSQKKIWKEINFNQINTILIEYSAYKMMKCNIKFSEAHFNFLFLLLEVENINLQGCNFGRKCTGNIFQGVRINKLNLSECGFAVNRIIQNFPDVLQGLMSLNISQSLLCNESLNKINSIPLKSLNISGCIKTVGQFFDSVWFTDQLKVKRKGKRANVNVDLLWTPQGALSENISILDVSCNSLSLENLKNILKLNLKELNITKSIRNEYLDHVNFPISLRILRARQIEFTYNQFKKLCELQLEKLEFEYVSNENEDFSCFNNSPLLNTLRELSVTISEYAENFISFISKCKLRYFECKMTTEDVTIDSFLSDNPENRKHLETFLIIQPDLLLTNSFLQNFSVLNLKELSFSLWCSDLRFRELLCCKNLHEYIVSLRLSDRDIEDDDLLEIIKFKRLEKLSFPFSSNINKDQFRTVIEMKTLKQIELEANVRGQLDINMAQLLCIAPVKTLNIYDDYSKSISDEAYKFLLNHGNLQSLGIEKLYMRTSIKPKMIDILKCINWKKITLDQCSCEENFLKLLMKNEYLHYSLEELCFTDSDVVWEDLANLMLSKLKFEQYATPVPSEFSQILIQSRISLFLHSLFLDCCKEVELDLLTESNLSQVDTH